MSLTLVLPALAVLLLCAYQLAYCIYHIFLNPLRTVPGPKLYSISYIPYARLYVSGQAHRRILSLHQTYGSVVRVGPNHISINHPDGMHQVRGHRKANEAENPKEPLHSLPNRDNIVGSAREDHRRFRRALAHGFSAQAMLAQQPIIQSYVDKLMARLHGESRDGARAVNVERWFNFATFDVVGDLAFGEPFGCLDDGTYHPWVALVFQSIKNMAFIASSRRLAWVGPLLLMTMLPRGLADKLAMNKSLSREKLRKRLALGTARPDFVDAMVRKSESAGSAMTFEELASNAFILIVAGSETTATLLTAATYFLATNPGPLAKLTEEVRSAFETEDQIDMSSVQNLSYLLAVLDESMRMYPPAPASSPRMAREGGDTIVGQYIPEGTALDVWQWAVFNNPDHFTAPEEFVPERWLGDDRFANDAKQAFQPFSVGPRNCLGKNLAYAEMRLILTRLVWNFDIRLAEDSLDWANKSEVYVLWQKGPVNVYLAPRA
ncbi:trichothecene c-15 hydroxylase [Colletotrichum plurivorum]|uniref:Trichothecene c-15 hydroxylase n=1 Tax=Colletotrichum plurivorum TaxID=2175906 RepID=A0A8H6JBQ4_9PEZI|nr:trichothecene c-15 hydroxylase [Colletotrichum plurivorum]